MVNLTRILCLILSLLLLNSTSQADDFEKDLDRLRYALQISKFSDGNLEFFFNPNIGKKSFRLNSQRAPWAGNYFPMAKGGLANRWQDRRGPQINDFSDINTGIDYFKSLTQKQIDTLSPAEKYDILVGNYDLPMTKFELTHRGPLRDMPIEHWEGFCNGVRCAGINLKEPKHAVNFKNPDGINIRFEPADLKALAGASYFYVEKYSQLGSPTRNTSAEDQPNAAVFDLAVRYFLGEKKKSFVIDSHLQAEIWNESVVGFERNLSEPQFLDLEEQARFPWAVSKIRVKGFLEALGEIGISKVNGPTQKMVSDGSLLAKVPIHYTLYLDSEGAARDGVWHNRSNAKRGVDFVWFGGGEGADDQYRTNKNKNETIDFQILKRLIKKAQRPMCKGLFS